MKKQPYLCNMHWVPAIAGALCLSGCALGEDYKRPDTKLDNSWQITKEQTGDITHITEEKTPWWESQPDKLLAEMITRALKNNNDLKIAKARIAEAEANEDFADSVLFPQVDATGSLGRGTIGGSFGDRMDTTSRAGVSGRWDIDLFGGNRRRSEAAEAGVEATEAEMARTCLLLIAEVARTYVELRNLQAQEALTMRNLELQQDTVKITDAHREEEMVSDLDVLRARAQLNDTKSRLPQIKAAIYAGKNRLAVLLGEKLEPVLDALKTPSDIPSFTPQLVEKTPIEVIRNRPDVQSAERRLAQQTALKAAAFTDFFPKLSLEGFFGAATSNAFGNFTQTNGTLNGLLPLLNFGRIESQFDAANARKQQAFYGYKQTILTAMEDVEVSYSAYLNEREREQTLAAVANEQAKAVDIAREQYLVGIGRQLDLIDAQRNALNAESAHAQSKALVSQNLIQLYSALGMGQLPVKE